MAEIRDELILDIDQALRQINDIERALDGALAAVDVRLDATSAQRQIDQLAQNAESALGDVDVNIDSTGAARLNDELAGVERNLAQADENADDLASSVRRVDRAASDVNTTTKDMSQSFDKLDVVAKRLLQAFAAIGAAQLLGQALRGANAAVQQFAILEDSVNAVNVIFGNASESVLEFGETAAESAGLSTSAFNQAVTPLGALLQNFGFDAREAADASVILVQRAADLASVLGGDVQTALIAVSSALRGQSEPLTAYGATISAARVEQFALANGLAATKSEITDAITLQARYGLILEDTNRVAGDYAATSGDLANAQRTLGGLATDLAAEIGEALAPAFEALLAQGPGLIDLFASLTPALADAAGNAAAAASGIQVGAANTVLGIGGITNALGSFANLVQAGAEGIKGIGLSLNPFREAGEEFADFNIQLDEFNNNIAQDFINNAGLQIPRAIQAGITPINAFGIAIASLAQKDDSLETIQLGFERLRIQSGLTQEQTQRVVRELLLQADALELNADEISLLEGQQRILNEALDDGGRANADYLASVGAVGEVMRTVFGDTTTFTAFATDTETAASAAAESLAELATAAEAQATRTADAFDLFADQPEKIAESFREGVAALRESVEAQLDFDINIAILRALGLDALASDFERIGVGAADQLVQAVNDIPAAIEADQLLQGFGVLGEDAFAALVDRFVSVGMTAADAKKLAESLSSPQVVAAAEEAGVEVGTRTGVGTVSAYREALLAESAQIDAENIQAIIGERVTTAFTADDQAEFAAGQTLDAYEQKALEVASDPAFFQTVREQLQTLFAGVTFDIDASQFNFPDSGEFQGTIGSGAVLNTSAPPITGTVPSSTPTANFTYAPTINNPTVEDLETTMAKDQQIMGAVAGILNGGFKL